MKNLNYYEKIALSPLRIDGQLLDTKFGVIQNISAGDADVWEGGGSYTGQPEAFTPEIVSIVSSDVNDTSEGTGARTVTISGLKTSTSEEYETETVSLNGTTSVETINSWWRIVRASVNTAGSTGSNAGTITINSQTTTANVFCTILPSYNQTLIAAYTVPYNYSMIIKSLHIGLSRANGGAGSCRAALQIRKPNEVFQSKRVYEISNSAPVNIHYNGGIIATAGSDIKFRLFDVSDASSYVDASFEYLLVKLN